MWVFTAALQNDPCRPYTGSNTTIHKSSRNFRLPWASGDSIGESAKPRPGRHDTPRVWCCSVLARTMFPARRDFNLLEDTKIYAVLRWRLSVGVCIVVVGDRCGERAQLWHVEFASQNLERENSHHQFGIINWRMAFT